MKKNEQNGVDPRLVDIHRDFDKFTALVCLFPLFSLYSSHSHYRVDLEYEENGCYLIMSAVP